MQGPHRLSDGQPGTTSLLLQPLASLLNRAAGTHNSSTKLTPLGDGDRYFHRLDHVELNRSVGRCSMAALAGDLTSVLNPFDLTLHFARQPEPDLEFTEEELDQTITTKTRGTMPSPKKSGGGGRPILWIVLLALVGGLAYDATMEPEMLEEWLSPYLGESTPPPVAITPKPMAPKPVTPPTPVPQAVPSPSSQASTPVAPPPSPATPPATPVAPTAPAVAPPPQTAEDP